MVKKLNESAQFAFNDRLNAEEYVEIIDNLICEYRDWKLCDYIQNNTEKFTPEDVTAAERWVKRHWENYKYRLKQLNSQLDKDCKEETERWISEYTSKYGVN